MNEARRMMRGLMAAAAVGGREVPDSGLEEVREMLQAHPMQCHCAVCVAYVTGRTTAEGMLAAWEALEAARKPQDAPEAI